MAFNLLCMCVQEDGRGLTAKREGYDSAESSFLHHRMKYSSHSNDPLLAIERYTHSMSSANDPNSIGPEAINVSITCSRIPQNHEVVQQASDLLTQKSSFMTSTLPTSTQIWRGSSSANPQISREKERDHFQKTASTHPPRPVSRVSDKGIYLTNGVVKTDNHGRSTTLPQQLLVHPTGLKQATITQHIVEPLDTRQINQPSVAHKQQDSATIPPSTHSVMVEEGEVKPSKSLRIYLSSHNGPSIAPAGVRAVATHRLRPVTGNTMIKGRGLVTVGR